MLRTSDNENVRLDGNAIGPGAVAGCCASFSRRRSPRLEVHAQDVARSALSEPSTCICTRWLPVQCSAADGARAY